MRIELDENAKDLIRKCENNVVDTSTMGACQVFLEEIDRGNVVLDDESGQSYINKSRESEETESGEGGISQEEVPQVVRIAFIVRDSDDITNRDVKTAANRVIRRVELM
ncbi:hypothetical protein [Methanobacterium sp. ACI-7]|uniref:hypothetical protein n=1 Tax=unclassified Methanobacterium TaxID=2627676 RepID=UPI0039C0EB56